MKRSRIWFIRSRSGWKSDEMVMNLVYSFPFRMENRMKRSRIWSIRPRSSWNSGETVTNLVYSFPFRLEFR
ncbi:hypothetical protein D4T97_016585 [Siminovitchia acidinfaciens]|uniref:Uncharacterized protein n=1 Tax=Siminovitchia acidinfaciens TaxID=2321395 RepID=A0A429XVG3_9BACI|nr:hypothetical protein [Siminovitchia acidinfaciens]RST72258.1 hypothetical protein D4T97_016585 [Siminovitchia acidinfaciens]